MVERSLALGPTDSRVSCGGMAHPVDSRRRFLRREGRVRSGIARESSCPTQSHGCGVRPDWSVPESGLEVSRARSVVKGRRGSYTGPVSPTVVDPSVSGDSPTTSGTRERPTHDRGVGTLTPNPRSDPTSPPSLESRCFSRRIGGSVFPHPFPTHPTVQECRVRRPRNTPSRTLSVRSTPVIRHEPSTRSPWFSDLLVSRHVICTRSGYRCPTTVSIHFTNRPSIHFQS